MWREKGAATRDVWHVKARSVQRGDGQRNTSPAQEGKGEEEEEEKSAGKCQKQLLEDLRRRFLACELRVERRERVEREGSPGSSGALEQAG